MQAQTPKPTLAARLAYALRELQTAEAPAVDLLAAVAPWLAPAFPAAYTLANVAFVLLADWGNPWFAVPVGVLVACGVEAVGIAAVHTIIGLWGRERSGGLVGLAGAALGMYLVIVVGANVALDYQAERPQIIIWAAALLCLMTVTGGIIAGVRARAARAAADEQEKQDAIRADADKALAEDARQFDQETAQWEARRKAEAEAQREQREHEAHMAQIAADAEAKRMSHELELERMRHAPPPPTSPLVRQPKRAKRVATTYSMDQLSQWVADNSTLGPQKKALGLKSAFGAKNKDIAETIGVHATTVGRWLESE